MQISSIKLKNFKQFSDFEAEFSGGMNVIRGQNEQGKSTLVSAILAGLFYDPSRRNQAISALQKWGSEDLFRIEMTLTNGAEKYLLAKDFQEKFFSLSEETSGNTWTTMEEAQPVIAGLLGTDDPKLFEATAAVRQDALANIHEGKRELEQAIQSFVTSGGDQVSAVEVLRLLEKKLREAEKGLERPTSTPGTLKALLDEKATLEAQIQETEQTVADRSKRQNENEVLRDELRQRKDEQKVRQKTLSSSKQKRELAKQKKDLEKRFAQAEQVRAALENQQKDGPNKAKEQVEAELGWFNKAIGAYKEIEAQRKVLDRKISKLDILEELNEPNILLNPGMLGGLILSALAIGGFRYYAWSLFALIPAALLFLWAFQTKRHARLQKKEVRIEAAHRKEDEELEQRQQEILKESETVSLDAMQERQKQLSAERDALLKGGAQLDTLLGGKTSEEAEQERMQIAKELAMIEAQEQELAGGEIDAQTESKMTIETEQAEQEIGQMTEQGIENRARIEATPASNEELLVLQERLAEVETELGREQMLADAHRLAIDVIAKSKDAVTKKAKETLQELMQAYLPRITQGRYSQARVDDDLRVTIDTAEQEGGEVAPEGALSRGTVDQVYLVARLALMKLLYADIKPPIILDDPFTTFDDIRRAMTMEVLGEFSKDWQMFLFTHSSDYDGWANTVVQLGETSQTEQS